MIASILRRTRAVLAWLEVGANQRRIYRDGRLLVPVLAAAGLLSSGDARIALEVLAALAGASGLHLAATSAPPAKPRRPRDGPTKPR